MPRISFLPVINYPCSLPVILLQAFTIASISGIYRGKGVWVGFDESW